MPEALLVAAVLLLLVLVVLQVRNLLARPPETPAIDMLQNQMNASIQQTNQQLDALRKALNDSIQTLSGQVSQSVAESSKTVGDRLDNTTKIVGDVRQQLGRLELSSKQMLEVGKDIAKLEDILQPPKLRGSMIIFVNAVGSMNEHVGDFHLSQDEIESR